MMIRYIGSNKMMRNMYVYGIRNTAIKCRKICQGIFVCIFLVKRLQDVDMILARDCLIKGVQEHCDKGPITPAGLWSRVGRDGSATVQKF